jgi:hypothetical protein
VFSAPQFRVFSLFFIVFYIYKHKKPENKKDPYSADRPEADGGRANDTFGFFE